MAENSNKWKVYLLKRQWMFWIATSYHILEVGMTQRFAQSPTPDWQGNSLGQVYRTQFALSTRIIPPLPTQKSQKILTVSRDSYVFHPPFKPSSAGAFICWGAAR